MRPLAPLLIIASLAILACGDDGSGETPAPSVIVPARAASGLAIIPLRFDGGELRVEVAATPEDRALGLGNRDILEIDAGMLFDLGTTRAPNFTMRGMRIPLDMIWIAEDRRITQVTADIQPEPDVPDTQLTPYTPDQPVRYVLEVNAGTAARLGLEPGDELEFELPGP
jgi:uncharacterized membrane protein (UPF0127 family)